MTIHQPTVADVDSVKKEPLGGTMGKTDHADLSKVDTHGDGESATYDRFHRLGWKRLSVILVVEAVALGTLSLPSAFATLGMVLGVILCVFLGIAAIYAAYIIGEVKLKYSSVKHYVDMGRLLFGEIGFHIFSVAFVVQLTLVVGSHCLTGKTAFVAVTGSSACGLLFSAASTGALILLAIPPSFAEIAILGYIDFISITVAVGITIIATGIQASESPAGLAGADWSAWPRQGATFPEIMTAICNILFAYAFAIAMPSFMDELKTPKDFRKSVLAVGIVEIGIYTFTGAILYAFVGKDVQSPALLSTSPLISKIAFGIAFPVIFISGSINITVIGRFIYGQIFHSSPTMRNVSSRKGWATWLALVFVVSIFAWITAEAIPLFYELLSIISALFVSAFSYYIPPVMWFMLLMEGRWYDRHNLATTVVNAIIFAIGMMIFVCGTYTSVVEIDRSLKSGGAQKPFSC